MAGKGKEDNPHRDNSDNRMGQEEKQSGGKRCNAVGMGSVESSANKQETITHRVIDKEEYNDGFVFHLRGDNINEDGTTSTQIIDTRKTESFNYIIGKVKGVSYPIGLVITALKSPVGIVGMIIIPCVILIIFEIIKIANEVNKDKIEKNKDKEKELEIKNLELLELKKRLEELEKKEGKKDEGTKIFDEE